MVDRREEDTEYTKLGACCFSHEKFKKNSRYMQY